MSTEAVPSATDADLPAESDDLGPLLTPGEVAKLFHVNPRTVTRWARSGKITSVRTLGGHRRYLQREIESLLHPGGQHPTSTS